MLKARNDYQQVSFWRGIVPNSFFNTVEKTQTNLLWSSKQVRVVDPMPQVYGDFWFSKARFEDSPPFHIWKWRVLGSPGARDSTGTSVRPWEEARWLFFESGVYRSTWSGIFLREQLTTWFYWIWGMDFTFPFLISIALLTWNLVFSAPAYLTATGLQIQATCNLSSHKDNVSIC